MYAGYIPAWKKAPFIRCLLPLIAGIILQWHLQLPVQTGWFAFLFSFFLLLFLFVLPYFNLYRFAAVSGVAIIIFFLALGSLLAWYKDIRHNDQWLGKTYQKTYTVIATLREPPVEKINSYKIPATVTAISKAGELTPVKTGIIIYLKKNASILSLDYGSQIIFLKPLQEIKNAGNPGGFDYKQYCLFQGITHQVYLDSGEFVLIKKKNEALVAKTLFLIRMKVLSILRSYIKPGKEQGLAEALLIGYKDDLDKNLVQSYSNTGVVHIIAISGLHLGLIYWLLVQLFRPFKKRKSFKWLIPVIILSCLWLFSLLAGGQPSVLRSAVMFTCILLAEILSKKTSIYNTLALSAFVLLCINPYWLWDVGFQLSYTAVLSIVIFMRPIYNWFCIKNKILDFIWKLNAVSIAAQLLTTPLSIYHFHQFPNFFLLTNFVAVPLSSLVVLGEIVLCLFSFIPFPADILGKILLWLLWLMNSYIERIELLPGSLWDGMQISILQACLLVLIVAGFGFWFLEKQKNGAWIGMIAMMGFVFLRSFSFYQSGQQQKIIVYNIPKHRAIDVLDGRNYFFIGDNNLLTDDFIINFYIQPSRILHRVEAANESQTFFKKEQLLGVGSKHILLVDDSYYFENITGKKIDLDLVIVSKNPTFYLPGLAESFNIKKIVFDGSVPSWKLKYWIRDCDSLHIPWHDTAEKGAFVMNLN